MTWHGQVICFLAQFLDQLAMLRKPPLDLVFISEASRILHILTHAFRRDRDGAPIRSCLHCYVHLISVSPSWTFTRSENWPECIVFVSSSCYSHPSWSPQQRQTDQHSTSSDMARNPATLRTRVWMPTASDEHNASGMCSVSTQHMTSAISSPRGQTDVCHCLYWRSLRLNQIMLI